MMRVSRVLCAVDIGEPGRAAFAQALALARVHDASIGIVAAISPDRAFNRGSAQRLAYLAGLRERAEAAGIDVRVSVQRGRTAEIILLHAGARRPDLIVVSAHHDADTGAAAGAVAEDVVRGASCPTLVVGASRRAFRAAGVFRTVVCAVDLSGGARSAVDGALAAAAGPDRTIALLHVIRGPREERARPDRTHREYDRHIRHEAMDRLQSLIPEDMRGTVVARVARGHVATEVFRAVRALDADLVVIAARRRTRLGRHWFGTTRSIVRAADCPILAVPSREAAAAWPRLGRAA